MASIPVADAREDVAQIFLSYMNRAPEFQAMNHYVGIYNAILAAQGDSATAEQDAFKLLSAQIYADAGANGEVPVGPAISNAEYVAWIYENVLGREADEKGMDYWTTELENGSIQRPDLVAIVLAAAAGDERDGAYVANRTTVALEFAKWENSNPNILPTLQYNSADVLAGVNEDPATVEAAQDKLYSDTGGGEHFSLTTGADTYEGTAGNDVINALPVNAQGGDATTLSAFDSIDGGAGNDTLNIYTTDANNTSFPASATVKNVETVNIYNAQGAANLADAAKFQGVTALWQIGDKAAAVTNLAEATTAGFRGTADGSLSVSAATAATAATVALDGVADNASLSVQGAALNTVTVTGNLADTDEDGTSDLDLTVTAGSKAETVTLNTEVDVDLTLVGAAINTLDAPDSTGGVSLDVPRTEEVQTITLGSLGGTGARSFTLTVGETTLTTGSLGSNGGLFGIGARAPTAAEVLEDLQDDDGYADAPFTLALDGGNLVLTWKTGGSVDATAALAANSGGYSATAVETVEGGIALPSALHTITTGAGDDDVTSSFATTTKQGATISTGEGNDVITVLTTGSGATSVDAGAGDDRIVLNRLALNSSIDGGDGTDTAVVADGSFTTQSYDAINGFKGIEILEFSADLVTVDAAELSDFNSLSFTGGEIIVANLSADQTVTVDGGLGGSGENAELTLGGDIAETVNIVASYDEGDDADNPNESNTVTLIVNSDDDAAGGTLNLSGNSNVVFEDNDAEDGAYFATIDASEQTGTLAYTNVADVVEAITLGTDNGQDVLTVADGSTYGDMDVITNFDSVVDEDQTAEDADTVADVLVGITGDATLVELGDDVTTLTQAFAAAAADDASADGYVFFHFEENTYVFRDNGSGEGQYDNSDFALQLVGVHDLSADNDAYPAP